MTQVNGARPVAPDEMFVHLLADRVVSVDDLRRIVMATPEPPAHFGAGESSTTRAEAHVRRQALTPIMPPSPLARVALRAQPLTLE